MATYTDPATGGTYTTGKGGKTTGGSAAAGGGINPATGQYEGGSTAALKQPLSTMSLSDAQGQASQAFSGLVAPMTMTEIEAREQASNELTTETAGAIYDPNISREKQTGAAGVSTAKGVVGQRQGFNISTAEQAYVADVANKVQDRIREVENIKANYISQGNLSAADRADSQIQSLNEWNSQMTIAKANYALQLMSGNREQAGLELQQAQFGLQEKAQEFNQGMATKSLALDIAGITGDYTNPTTGEVVSTFASKQAVINNAFAKANLTGYYDGTETLESATTKAQLALQERGIIIDEKRLQIAITNANTVTESNEQNPLGFEEWLKAKGAEQQMTLTPSAGNKADYNEYVGQFNQLNNNYFNEIANSSNPSATEIKDVRRLEAAGLKNSPRDEQLNYLYGSPLEEPTKSENESSVWQWLSSEDAQSLSSDERKNQIMGLGLNPEDFNIY